MVPESSTTSLIVKKAIERAEKSDFHWMDHILMHVLCDENLSETIQSLEYGGGWEYVLYLYQYLIMQGSIKTAWEKHYESESKK